MTKLPQRVAMYRHHPTERDVICIKAEGADKNDVSLASIFAVTVDREAAAEHIVKSWNSYNERRAMYAAHAPISMDDARLFFIQNRESREKSYNWVDLMEAMAVLRFQYADKMLELESAQ